MREDISFHLRELNECIHLSKPSNNQSSRRWTQTFSTDYIQKSFNLLWNQMIISNIHAACPWIHGVTRLSRFTLPASFGRRRRSPGSAHTPSEQHSGDHPPTNSRAAEDQHCFNRTLLSLCTFWFISASVPERLHLWIHQAAVGAGRNSLGLWLRRSAEVAERMRMQCSSCLMDRFAVAME